MDTDKRWIKNPIGVHRLNLWLNFKVNKLDEKKAEFILADVKQYLPEQKKGSFDVIILDPPAFVKDRHKVREGLQGYRKINEMALRILPENGILVTASCSAHVSMQDFRFMLSEAASRAGRTVQIIETFTHGIDHPELVAFTEGEYLKCLFAIVR
jgi:23S rRNA (cytosine1962-C5)-methyltransferase